MQDFVRVMELDEMVLLGHSLGGHIALETAEGLMGLRGLFTTATPPLTFADTNRSPFLDHPELPLIFTGDLDMDQITRLAAIYWGDRTDQPLLFNEAISATDPLFRSTVGADVGNGNFRDEVKGIAGLPFPVALSVGERDPLVNREYMEHVVDGDKIWKGEIQVIEEAGHTPQLERPHVFNNLARSYVEEIFGAPVQ